MKNLSLKWLLVPLMLIFLGIGNAWADTYVMYPNNGSTFNSSWSKTSRTARQAYSNITTYGLQLMGESSGTYGEVTSKSTFTGISAISVSATASGSKNLELYYSANGSSWTKLTQVSVSKDQDKYNAYNYTLTGLPSTAIYLKLRASASSIYLYSVTITTGGSTKTLVYNANGGTGTMANTTGATVTAASCTFTAPTCKVFDHWNTAGNDGGASYNPGDAVAASTTLYAIWRNNPSDPTITFSNGNYTTGGSALNLSSLFSSNSSGTVTYSVTNAGGTGASIAGTSFSATTAGSCTVQASQAADAPCYNAKAVTATITVSAPTPATITLVNYDGDATTTGYYSGGSFTLPDENDFTCGELVFQGWSTVTIANSATKPTAATYYEPGAEVTLDASNTFYAVFAEASGGGSTTETDEFTYTSFFSACNPSGANVNGAYTNFSSKSGSASDAVYAGNIMQHGSGPANCKDYIQLRSNNSTSGIITTTSGGKAKKVTVEWNSTTANAKVLNIYGKSTAYSAASDLYADATDGDLLGTITKGTSTEYTITGDYEHIGLRSSDGTVYFDEISIDWQVEGGTTYSNYTTNCVNMIPVYLDAYHFGDTDGAKFAIYSWRNADASDNKLSDAFMTKVEDCYYGHLYEGEMPDNHDRVIFLRNASAAASPVKDGANKLNQTVDITTEANKDFFTIASGGAGNAYTGSWGVYTPNYAVTFDKNGVTSTSTWPSDQCKASGEKVTDPNITPLAMGKTFVGWYQEAEGTNAWVFNTNTVSAATTIYAKWNDVATKTIYLDASADLPADPSNKKWDADNVVLFARAYIDETSIGTNVKATSAISSCQPHVYQFVIPGNATHVSFARCATGTTELPAEWTNPPVYNQITGKTVENGKDHYVIDGWGSATLQSSAFTPVSYTITYNAGTNGTGSRANDSKLCGVAFTLPNSQVFTRNGYTMDGWATSDGGDKVYDLGESYTTDANLNLYPHWTEATYTVTLTTNGGTINAGNVTSYVYGTGATLPTDVTKAHATFQGWYASSTFEGDRVYTIGTTEYGNKQYYAKWEDVKWTVTWKANGATVRTDANIVDGNKVASVPSAPSDLTTGSDGCDAEFVGWVIEANDPGALSISSQSSTPSGMFTNVAGSPAITANTTFIAIYRQEQ